MESFDAVVGVLDCWSYYPRRIDIEEFETYRHKELENENLGLHVQTEEEK